MQASIASAYRESPDSCYSEVWPSQHPPRVCARPPQAACERACARVCAVCVCVCTHACAGFASGAIACAGISGWEEGVPAGETKAGAPLGLSGPRTVPRGWTAQRPHPQAASTLPRTFGSVGPRARAPCSACRAWLATGSAATAASRTPAGPASTWACCSASSARASTGRLTGPLGRGAGMEPRPRSPPPACFRSRSLGVHCSKVRSLTLDSWEPELLKVCGAVAGLVGGSQVGVCELGLRPAHLSPTS